MVDFSLEENLPEFVAYLAAAVAARGELQLAALENGNESEGRRLGYEITELCILEDALALVTRREDRDIITAYLLDTFALASLPFPTYRPILDVLTGLPPAAAEPSGVSDHEALTGIRGDPAHFHVKEALYLNQDALLDLLIEAPTVSLVATPSASATRGSTIDVTLVATVDLGSAPGPVTYSWTRNGTPIPGSGPTNTDVGVTDTATYVVTASVANAGGTPDPIVISDSDVVPFIVPIYYGVGVPGQVADASFAVGLTKLVSALTASRDLFFSQAVGDTRYYYQAKTDGPYDASGLSSILNNLAFEVLTSYPRTEVTLNLGAGAPAVVYYGYEYDTAAAAPTSSLKNTFKQ